MIYVTVRRVYPRETVFFFLSPESSGCRGYGDMTEKLGSYLTGPREPGLRLDMNRTEMVHVQFKDGRCGTTA